MLSELVDLVLPRSCVGCDRDGPVLCALCCRVELQPVALRGLHVVAATRYDGGVRAALLAYKERGRRDLAGPLGRLLALALHDVLGAVGAPPAGRVALVPVPSSAAARRERGGDHLRRLGRVASRSVHVPTVPALQLTRAVLDSAGLDPAARAANLHHAMSAVRPARGRGHAVLLDDITTTGATLREAARALRAAGWSVDGAAVVAVTERRLPGAQRVHEIRTAATSGTPARAGLT